MTAQGPIIGVLLAGGRSSRFGGARRFASFGLPVIADYASARIEEFAGMLSGVLAAMEWAREHRPEASVLFTAPPTRRSFRLIWWRG